MDSTKLKIILGILILMFLCTTVCAFKYKSDIDAERYYKQGASFYAKSNYSDAYYNFKQISSFSKLYKLSLLKQFICAYKLEDKKTAHSKLLELAKYTKDDSIYPYVLYNEANLAMELGINSKEQSLRKFKRILKNYPDNDFYYASAFKSATLSDTKYFAKEKYIEYLEYAPIGKFSQLTLENIKQYKSLLTKKDKEIVADSLFLNSRYEEALEYYKDTEFSNNWYKISKCYKALNKRKDEETALLNGLFLNYSDVKEKDIYTALNRIITLSGDNKIKILQEIYKRYPNKYIYPTVIFNLAEATKSIRAIKLYEQLVNEFPDSDWASNSLWEIFWYNYSQGRYKACIRLGEMHRKKYSKASDAPRVAYWTARAMLKEKKNQNAREVFYRILKDYPLSYYAFLSARQLKISKAPKIISKKPIADFNINSLNKFLFKEDKMLLYLANKDDYETIDEFKINNEYVKAWLMFKKGNYPNSINTAKNEYLKQHEENEELKISYSDKELRLIYPILYNKEINEHAQEFKQSPYLFMSLIREESHFNKDAISSAGAIGLAQLMPATASFIEKGPMTTNSIKNDNIKLGLKYFTYLTDFFEGNEYLAILAYNAGPGNVKKWINDPFIQSNDIDELVENIPYLETKNYIKKILSTYWIYFNIKI
ncbi:MAG: transglycosylase SLT domain-containing protein [Candidatus Gastranaerophilales bacterium]|nr:transglycosylase SLT domain-containing protein [Candidatus Gastranaerophilales bacterium]